MASPIEAKASARGTPREGKGVAGGGQHILGISAVDMVANIFICSQMFSRPVRQGRQVPQVAAGKMTRSPSVEPRDSHANEATVPETSCQNDRRQVLTPWSGGADPCDKCRRRPRGRGFRRSRGRVRKPRSAPTAAGMQNRRFQAHSNQQNLNTELRFLYQYCIPVKRELARGWKSGEVAFRGKLKSRMSRHLRRDARRARSFLR